MHLKCKAFTLVALLVVVAIIAVLVAMLLPSLKGARDKAKAAGCMANLRQFGIALQAYVIDSNGMLPYDVNGAYFNPNQFAYMGWATLLYPYLKIGVYYDPAIPTHWPGTPGQTYTTVLGDKIPVNVLCRGDYQMNRYLHGDPENAQWYGGGLGPIRLDSLKAPYHKAYLGDSYYPAYPATLAYWWAWPEWSYPTNPLDKIIYGFRRHLGGANLLMLDGHVEFLRGDYLASNSILGGSSYNIWWYIFFGAPYD